MSNNIKVKGFDAKAPRFKRSFKRCLTVELFNEYLKIYPESKINYATFKKIVQTYHNEIIIEVCNNHQGVNLPERVGYIFIGSCPKSKRKNIDHNKSKQLGFKVYHENWDSDDRICKIFYTKRTHGPFRSSMLWSFYASKFFKTSASNAFKEKPNLYIKVEHGFKVATLYDKK